MRASRLLAILIHLQLNRRVSAHQLAKEFEVSKRTIYRDIDELSLAGIPVYAEPGRDGGFSLVDGYRTRLTGLTAEEAMASALLHAEQVAADLGLGAAARDARRKLIASLPNASAEDASNISARILVDPTGWHHRPQTPPHLRLIDQAIAEGGQIRFRYQSWEKASDKQVSPLGLVLKTERWYLVARSKKRTGIYRLDQMSEVAVITAPADRPAGFNLSQYWAEATQEFEALIQKETALVRISRAGRAMLAQIRRTTVEENADGDDWQTLTLPFENNAHGVRDLLQLGGEVEVLEPVTLRAAVRDAALAIVGLYGEQ